MATLRVAVKPEAALMKVAQISKPGGVFELVEREIPAPGAGEVRVKVRACHGHPFRAPRGESERPRDRVI